MEFRTISSYSLPMTFTCQHSFASTISPSHPLTLFQTLFILFTSLSHIYLSLSSNPSHRLCVAELFIFHTENGLACCGPSHAGHSRRRHLQWQQLTCEYGCLFIVCLSNSILCGSECLQCCLSQISFHRLLE